MLPTTGAALLAFLLLVVPGLVFELVREAKKPTPSRSSFREATWVLFVGAAASALAFVCLAGIRAGVPTWMPDPRLWLAHTTSYETSHYRLVARTLAIGFLLACLLGVLSGYAARRIDRRHTLPTRNTTTPALYNAFYGRVKGGNVPVVTAHTADGNKFMGVLVEMDPRASHDEGWVVIEEPLRRITSENVEDLSVSDWQRVALPYSKLAEVWIRIADDPKHERATLLSLDTSSTAASHRRLEP